MTQPTDEASVPVLQAGRNYWRRGPATRLSTLIDAADYFDAFARVCEAAERQILILGWDFDRQEPLHRDNGSRALPDRLGEFLVELVRRKPRLHVYLLSWDFNMIYASERELLPALRLRLQTPRRFHFRLDGLHPVGASHHQKVVVVDDRVAFAGGIDLSRWRWDTPEHKPDDPRRTDPNGRPYPPFHDLMVMLEGDAAAILGELARTRWRRARGRHIKPPGDVTASPWPKSVAAELKDIDVAIARTEPAYRGRAEVREVEHLYLDAIAAARHVIYIENQYFTSRSLADALAERLQQDDGPEVILVLPEKTGGWLEQVTMDVLRYRVLEQLTRADVHDRLRIYYPHQPGLGDDCISVHAKLLVVDDRLLRIGSSNTSNRSMGLDTECDIAIEAGQGDDHISACIAGLRTRLLAEHLGCSSEDVDTALQREPGVIAAIERLRSDERSLRTLDWAVDKEVNELVPDDAVIDPSEPFNGEYLVTKYVPEKGQSTGQRRLRLFFGLVIGLLVLAALWRWTPLQALLSPERLSHYLQSLASSEARAVVAIAGFALASLVMVPVTLLAVICGLVFSGWEAYAYVMAGAMLSAITGFLAGRWFGKGLFAHMDGSRIEQLSKRLAERGTVAVALLRVVPIAPFAVFNLVAGSSHLGARQYLIGSLIGMAPGLGAITLFSKSLWNAVSAPSLPSIGTAVTVAAVLLAAAWLVKRWLRTS